MGDDRYLLHYKNIMQLRADTTNEELWEIYSKWCHNYDNDTLENLQSVIHINGAEILSKALENLGYNKDATILDFGCGTGVVGTELHKRGHTAIDGVDYSQEMLEIAKKKGAYNKLSQGTMGSDNCKDLGINPNQYDAAICIGVFTVGHVKGKGFDDLLHVLKPGGIACFSIRDCIANDPTYGYQENMNKLLNEGKWKLLTKSYERYHNEDPMAWVYVYQKL